MLELRLQSGQVVSFDGRVVEVFSDGAPSSRFHLVQLEVDAVEAADGSTTIELEDGAVTLGFVPAEAPACARLLAAIAQARAALEQPTLLRPPVG